MNMAWSGANIRIDASEVTAAFNQLSADLSAFTDWDLDSDDCEFDDLEHDYDWEAYVPTQMRAAFSATIRALPIDLRFLTWNIEAPERRQTVDPVVGYVGRITPSQGAIQLEGEFYELPGA